MPFREDPLKAFNRGEDRKSIPHLLPDGFVARARNVRFRDGVPERIGGYVPFLPAGVLPGKTIIYATQHIVGSDRVFLIVTSDGFMYRYDETTTATTLLRRAAVGASPVEQNWWSTNFGQTVIIGDGVNRPWRLLATAASEAAPAGKNILIPLHARQLATWEGGESWSVAAGITDLGDDTRTDVQAFLEGTRGRRYRWDASQTDKRVTLAQTTDILTSPYGVAPNFGTADPGEGLVRIYMYVNSGAANFTSGFIQFDDGTDANYRRFALPPALAEGANVIEAAFSASTTNGVPPTTGASRINVSITTGAGGQLDVTLDDLQVGYKNGPPVATKFGTVHRGFLFVASPSLLYRVLFSNAVNPAYFTPTDTLDVFGQTPVDKRVEVTALYSFFDTLIASTRNTVFGVSGFDRTTFVISEQTAGQGISDFPSTAPFGDSFMYYYKGRMYMYSASQLQAVSTPEDPLFAGVDIGRPVQGVRWTRWDAVWFAIKLTSGTHAVASYDYGSGARAWAYHDIPARAIYPYVDTAGRETLLTLHTDGRLYMQDNGASFNGSDFTTEIITKYFGQETHRNIRKWWDATVLAFFDPSLTMTFQYRVADNPSQFETAIWSSPLIITAATLAEGTRLPIGERGRFCQLRFTFSGATTIHTHLFPHAADLYMPFGVTEDGATPGPLLQAWRLVPPLTVRSVLTPAKA